MHVLSSPAGVAGLHDFHFLTCTGDTAVTKHAAWHLVMGGWSRWATAARLGALFGRASAWPAGGPHLLCTLSCVHPLSGGGHSSAALGAGLLHSVSCVRARCACDPWHVRGGWTDAVSPGRCATCRPRAPRPLPRCGHEGPNRPKPSGKARGRSEQRARGPEGETQIAVAERATKDAAVVTKSGPGLLRKQCSAFCVQPWSPALEGPPPTERTQAAPPCPALRSVLSLPVSPPGL